MGIDKCAEEYARIKGIKLVEFLPDYIKYGKVAPILRNKAIADESDFVLAFWNGHSKGTKRIIEYCKKINKMCTVVRKSGGSDEINVEDMSFDSLVSAEKRQIVFRSLINEYSNESFDVIENAPDVFNDIQFKLRNFSDRKNGKMETEISIECLSASIKIIIPILFFSKQDLFLLNELEEQISEIVIMPYHNKIKINICLPYFVDNESPFIKAWKRIKSECEKNHIDISEGFERGIELK